MKFDWVLFDADHTLFDFDRSAAESLADTMRNHGLDHRDEHWTLYNSINKECWNAYENGQMDRETMRLTRFTRFFEQIGASISDLETFASQYLAGLPCRPYFIDGAMDILTALHGRIKLGMITNGLAEVQRPRLTATGIDKMFEVIVVSGEIGMMKPDYLFFDHTHALMAHPDKSRVVVVGDSLNADMKGGKEFGYMTC